MKAGSHENTNIRYIILLTTVKVIIGFFRQAIASSFPTDSETFPTDIFSLQLSYI